MKSSGLQPLAENLWLLEFPMKLLGTSVGRRVTLIRLAHGELLVHSTAPFDGADCDAIRQLGPVGYILEATLFHDSFAEAGASAFPEARYFAPPGFQVRFDRPVESLESPPHEWEAELSLELMGGMPSVNEYAVLHKPSRTLVVADLVFNISPGADAWTSFFFRYFAGTHGRAGMSRMFRFMIRRRADFDQSVERMLAWEFDRLIMGHGRVIESGGKEQLRKALREYRRHR